MIWHENVLVDKILLLFCKIDKRSPDLDQPIIKIAMILTHYGRLSGRHLKCRPNHQGHHFKWRP